MERTVTCIICYKNFDTDVIYLENVCSSKCNKKKEEIKNKFKNPKSFQKLLMRLKYIQDCNLISFKKVTAVKEICNFFKVDDFYKDLANLKNPSPCGLKEAKEFYEEVIEHGNIGQ